jgi:diphthamide synthase (EF-2-diphthine--ammonia ligase)
MDCIAFGDLFLEDIRRYREDKMQGTGLDLCFPLWGMPTNELAYEMIEGGLKAKISCLDLRLMPAHFSGHDFNTDFLNALPATVDPCGENGEFHTFTWAGPMFTKSITITTGETVTRDGYVYTDLLSAN